MTRRPVEFLRALLMRRCLVGSKLRPKKRWTPSDAVGNAVLQMLEDGSREVTLTADNISVYLRDDPLCGFRAPPVQKAFRALLDWATTSEHAKHPRKVRLSCAKGVIEAEVNAVGRVVRIKRIIRRMGEKQFGK